MSLKKAEFLDIFNLMSISNSMLKSFLTSGPGSTIPIARVIIQCSANGFVFFFCQCQPYEQRLHL